MCVLHFQDGDRHKAVELPPSVSSAGREMVEIFPPRNGTRPWYGLSQHSSGSTFFGAQILMRGGAQDGFVKLCEYL